MGAAVRSTSQTASQFFIATERKIPIYPDPVHDVNQNRNKSELNFAERRIISLYFPYIPFQKSSNHFIFFVTNKSIPRNTATMTVSIASIHTMLFCAPGFTLM